MVKINPLASVSLTSDTTTLNANFSEVTTAFNNTLSRDGSTPNNMLADLDMDSQKIINCIEATTSTEPARYSQLNIAGLTDTDLTGLTDGQFLVWQASTSKFIPSNVFLVSGGGGGAVDSVNGEIGVVVLTTVDIAENTNLYYTQARFDTAFGIKSTTDLSEGTNLYYTQGRFDTAFTAKSTTDLSEGTNLYYTDERAQDTIATSLTDTATIDFVYNDGANTITADVKTGSIQTTQLGGDITTAGKALLDDATAAAQRTTLGLGNAALQSYETGTFTPTYTFSTVGDSTWSYTEQTGAYVKVGKMTSFSIDIDGTPTHTTATGTISIVSLPFLADLSSGGVIHFAVGVISNMTWPTSVTNIQARVAHNSNALNVYGFGSGIAQTNISTTSFPSGSARRLRLGGSYRTV